MIIAASIENSYLYGDIVPSILKLRYQGFKERQNYDVPSYKDMEFDVYDNPATTYLAWRDDDNVVRGCSRLLCTTQPYMIEQLWPDLVQAQALPKEQGVWEASRFCIDKSLPVEVRKKIHIELLCAFHEFGIARNIDWMIGVMTPPIWRAVFMSAGWPIEYLGPIKVLPSMEKIVSGKMKISKKVLHSLKKRGGLESDVLEEGQIRRAEYVV